MIDRPLADGYALVTGGAGFIGTNLVHRLARGGLNVLVFDDFSRAGVQHNARWLASTEPKRVRIVHGDVRNVAQVSEAVSGASQVFHFAAQVAVTTSLEDPLTDFEINAGGTLNVLEAIRRRAQRPPLIFTSTNKVYGALSRVNLKQSGDRYAPVDPALATRGIGEDEPLDFHSPYGCSKGAADQYVRDYARSFGIPSVVFRMSCIYGPHQCGSEDQGWLAHFISCALHRKRLTLFGDGFQVRDALFVDDLVDALVLARDHAVSLAGRAFNIGGGPANSTSLREALDRISQLVPGSRDLSWQAERGGDQKYYVSNTTEFQRATGWSPQVSLDDGLARLTAWMREFSWDPTESPASMREQVARPASEPLSA